MKTRLFLLVFFLVLAMLPSSAQQITLPKLCKPCLFYGGDFNVRDPNADYFWNENTVRDPNTQTYGVITVPKHHTLLIESILFQTLFQQTQKLDPKGASWEIRTGEVFGSGGTLVASGIGTVAMQPTGRQANGAVEYSLAVKVNPAVEISGGQSDHGTQYWFNLTPQCTNPNDPSCSSAVYYVSNTTNQANAFRGIAQPAGLAVINSVFRGNQWEGLCGLGFTGCQWLSFGLMGKVVQ